MTLTLLYLQKSARWQYVLTAILLVSIAFFTLDRLTPAVYHHINRRPHPILLDDGQENLLHKPVHPIAVNLVTASLAHDDMSWLSSVRIANLSILRYVADAPSARYHPPVAKGREALMYFTYLYDHYDTLPDVSIFIHAEEIPWHLDGSLLHNTSFALSHLDLPQVLARGYFSLRVTWRGACPAWINTTKTQDDWDKPEEPFMAEAWRANFGDEVSVPEILAGPCCSQFAVSRDAIRRRPREQYKRSMDWLVETEMSDYFVGRVWEHMWPWLFKEEARDCSPERYSFCQMYELCFISDAELSDYEELWEERKRLLEDTTFLHTVWRPKQATEARENLDRVVNSIERKMKEVWDRGRDPHVKANILKYLNG